MNYYFDANINELTSAINLYRRKAKTSLDIQYAERAEQMLKDPSTKLDDLQNVVYQRLSGLQKGISAEMELAGQKKPTISPAVSAPHPPAPQVDSNKPTISNTGTNTKSVTAEDKEGWLKKAKDAMGKGWDTYKGALTGKKGRWVQAGAIAGTVAGAAGTGYGIYKGVKAIKNRNKKQDEDQEQLNEQQERRVAFSRSREQNEFSSLERLLGDNYIEN